MNYLQGFALAISIIICTCCVTGAIVSCVTKCCGGYEEDVKKAKRAFRWFLPSALLSFILLFGAMLIPSTKELCAIKAIPMIVNNEQVQELPNKVVDLANEWIDAQRTSFADGLKPDKESK